MKKFIIFVVIVIAAAAVWFYENKTTSNDDEIFAPAPEANSAEVVKEVENIDIGTIDKEFEGIDQELNGL